MKPIQKTWRGFVVGLKNAALRWGVGPNWSWSTGLGRTAINYQAAVGDGRGNSIVVACITTLCRSFLEAPLRVRRYRGDDLEPDPKHALLALVRRPNHYYAGRALWRATIADRALTGNAYWFKRRSGVNRVVELWWLPSQLVTPQGTDTEFIAHYDYAINGQNYRIPRADIVHFRWTLDPRNPRLGASPLASLMREVFTDDEAANYASSMLRNMGVPGVILSPADEDGEITPDQADQMKADFRQRFGGDMRGEPLVLNGNVKVDAVSFSPEQMQTRELRRVPEERIAAVIGVPAVLVGLGAGLERSTYSNFAEAREAFFEEHLIPLGMDFAEELMLQLMPDFDDPSAVELDFDVSDIRVLQEDHNTLATRLVTLLAGGAMLVDEVRQEMGLDALPGGVGEVLYVPSMITVTKPADLGAEPEPAPAPVALLPPGLADEGGEDDDQPTELRRVASAILGEMKRLQIAAPANGNGHAAPALIGAGEG